MSTFVLRDAWLWNEEHEAYDLSEVSFSCNQGRTLAVVGSPTSGSDTLANWLAGRLDRGYRFEGEVSGLESVAAVDELIGHGLNPHMRVREVFAALRESSPPFFDHLQDLLAAIQSFDVASVEDKFPEEMPPLVRAKLEVLLLLARKPSVLITNLSGSSLVATEKFEVMELLKTIHELQQNAWIIFDRHVSNSARFADEMLVMLNGRVIEQGSTADVVNRPAHPMTIALSEYGSKLLTMQLGATVSQLLEPLTKQGCPFSYKCAVAQKVGLGTCQKDVPQLHNESVSQAVRCHASKEDRQVYRLHLRGQ
jgi:ABC-type dipeptide/oligopeptide/nickel transport system ATPase component